MNKISLHESKTLVLRNVLIKGVELENAEFSLEVLSMDNYLKAKGTIPIGPLAQKLIVENDEHGTTNAKLFLLRQSKDYINHIDRPFKMEAVLRISDCLYARFCDEENKVRYAYDKLHLFAYENDISLSNETYTIFVNQVDDKLTADVFIEKKHESK